MDDTENITPSIHGDYSCNTQKINPPPFQLRRALSPLNSFAICRDDHIASKELTTTTGSRTKPPTKSRPTDKPPKALKSVNPSTTAVNHASSTLGSLGNASSRRRSSSTSSVQRLAHSYSHDSTSSAGDDMSVTSIKSINSLKSVRSASSVRTVKNSTLKAGDMNTNTARGRSRDEVDRRVRSRSNYSALPIGRGASSSSSSGSGSRSLRSTVGHDDSIQDSGTDVILKRYATRSATNPTSNHDSSWLDDARRYKEDREVRSKSKQKPIESAVDEVLIPELNRSRLRIPHGHGVPTSKGDDVTMETPSKKMAPYSSLSNRIASGFRSPFKSPKIATIESPVPHGQIPVQLSEVARPRRLSKNLLEDISGFDPNVSQVKILSDELFGLGTGITDEDIRKALNMKSSKSSKYDFRKQLEETNSYVNVLKGTLSALQRGKDKFVFGAMEAEKTARNGWGRALKCANDLDEEKVALKENIKDLEFNHTKVHESSVDVQKELSTAAEKVHGMELELSKMKMKIEECENEKIRSSVALEIERGRNNEMLKQLESWRSDISVIEGSKMDAIKEAEVHAASIFEEEKKALLSRLEEKHSESDRYKFRVHELEAQLSFKESELQRTRLDLEAVSNRAYVKENDLTELMKTIGEIQRSGQTREEEANKMRKEAEKTVMVLNSDNSLLLHENEMLKDALDASKAEFVQAHQANQALNTELEKIKHEMGSNSSTLQLERELRSRSEQKEREERNERIALSAQMVAMTKEHTQLEAHLRQTNELTMTRTQELVQEKEKSIEEKQNQLSSAHERIAGLEAEIKSLIGSINEEKTIADAKCAEEISQLRGQVNLLNERLRMEEKKTHTVGIASAEQYKDFQSQIQLLNAERRRMHNLIQELRGNVRVFARIRPYLPDDQADDDSTTPILANGENAIKVVMPDDKTKYDFTFDRVFSPGVGQESIFTEVSEFVQSALDGYNVCLFSYGQTGSGKTYTMQGFGTGQMRGIIPRAIEQVGNYKQQLEKDGWQYEMQVSFLEIYNETIRDLLRDDGSELLKHEVKVDADGRRFVSDLTMVPLEPTDKEAVEAVMRQAAKHRAVGSTDMNSASSRSHSVFTLHLTAFHPTQRQALRGMLNLVDLAGSERLSRSNVSGDRAKEAVAINKSLSALTDVFAAIGKKASHIPFRNSKLTYLLQPSLSGDGKTLMMVNLSPTELSVQESLCSLRFAAQVNKCELGKAKSSVEYLSEDEVIPSSQNGTPGKKRTATATGSAPRNVKARSNK